MDFPQISGSIDVVVVGVLIGAVGYVTNSQLAIGVGLVIAVIGLLKVGYDHLTNFEDPLGIEEWAER